MASRAVAPAPPARTAEPGRTHMVQRAALKISDPSDAAEREAESTARRVMTMPNPAIAPRERVSLLAARAPAVKAQPKAKAKANETAPEVTAAIKAERGKGSALPVKTRAFMEPRFKASFAGVRIHTGKAAADLSEKVGARAFAYGRDIFFSPGAFQPDTPGGQELLAHELTHTIQQREVVQREAEVRENTAPQVQRFGIPKFITDGAASLANAAGAALDAAIKVVKDFAADKAGLLPGFKLLTLIIGKNPVNDQPVSGGGAAILREIVGFIPFGDKIVEAFNNHGIFEKGGAFVETQFKALSHLGGTLISGIKGVFSKIGLSDATNPGGVWDRITGFFSTAFGAIKDFGVGLVKGVVTLVREVIIPPLGRWAAANIPKWDLLMAVLGKNPVSDDQESPASQIIGAFMTLIGQEEIWSNIKKGNAVARAWQWFQNALKGAKSLVSALPGQVMATLKSFTIMDVLTIAGAFKKILALFGSFVGQFGSWALGTTLDLLEIILSVVAPPVIPYLKKAGGAFKTIVRNPVGFVRTLVAAGKQGFSQFAGNFLAHLKAALIGWLTGSLAGAGIYIPAGFSFLEILKFVLSVMGLTWANLRAKLVAATNETVVKGLEEGFHIVKTLVTEGPAAAWQEIVKSLTNLKQMAIDAVMDFVKSKVVEIAVTKLLSMLSPAGAFIQAIIAIYNTIMFFVERIRQIAAVAASFIDSIAAIASGNITPAAARVEKTMAGMLVLVISFLARLAGLGKVSDAIVGLVKKIQAPIDKALNSVVAWIVAQAKKLGKLLLGKDGKPSADPRTDAQKLAAVKAAQSEADALVWQNEASPESIGKGLNAIKTKHKLTAITLKHDGDDYFVNVKINPDLDTKKRKFDPMDMKVGDVIIARHKEVKLKGGDKIVWIPGSATLVDKGKKVFNWASANLKTQRTWAGVKFSDQDTKWKKGHTSQVIVSDIKLLELNENESWPDFNDARAVLNWRHHDFQLNPSGKQWEHIIEKFAGGPNSSENLALTASTVNNKLGQLFGAKYASHEGPPGQPGTNGLPLRHALKAQPASAQTIWKQFFYSQLKVTLKGGSSPRGRWRELS